ncbi:diguanylate cyclase domain-containing protein [Kiloniella sp.]|uniref:diguanylate cyclase domain-containing protein n=1 Tax=Kiloniella sp. TaxID=1938587 RepID=UPI003B02397E
MLIVIYLLYVKLSETIHINRLLGGRHLFLLNKAEKSQFTLLFPGKDAEEALDWLEDVRERIQDTIFVVRGKDRPTKKPKSTKNKTTRKRPDGKRVKVTVSIGLSERTDKQEEPSDVMKKADRALYKAKDKGRNCVISK